MFRRQSLLLPLHEENMMFGSLLLILLTICTLFRTLEALRIQVCPKKGITPTLFTFLFFSDGIGTLKILFDPGGVWILREEILHQLRLVVYPCLSHDFQGCIHPMWLFGISSLNSINSPLLIVQP